MLQSLAMRRQIKEIERRIRASPEKAFSAFRAVINEHRDVLVQKGVIDKHTGEIDFKKLKLVLKKDKVFAQRFYVAVAEKSGLSGDKLLVGKALTNMGIRAGLAARGAGGAGLTAVTAAEVARLNAFGDHLARKFAGGSFSELIKKYNTNEKFRAAVNNYITKAVNSDKTLAGLKGYKPEEIVSGITAVKAATMSRTDLLRDAFKPAMKSYAKNIASFAGMMATSMGALYVITGSTIPLTGNPQLSQTLYMSYYGTMGALSTIKTLSPFYIQDAIRQSQQLLQQQQQVG